MNTNDELLSELARRFEWHGNNAYRGKTPQNASPLYSHLSLEVAKDRDILAIVAGADLAQQVSNLLFGAVHFLLLGSRQHPLREFFPDLVSSARPLQGAYPFFRDFCLKNSEEIHQLITSQRVQTNEVGRAACLLPAFELISRRVERKPLALIEIGASAGLHLRWDKYDYDYGKAGQININNARVKLSCAPVGQQMPPIPNDFPEASSRISIDLNPMDAYDETAMRWLRALIWPEHTDRTQALQQAIDIAQENPVTLLKGDAGELITDVLNQASPEATICVFHSYTLNQCSTEVRMHILALIETFAQQRDLFRVSQGWFSGQEQPQLELFSYKGGEVRRELLAYCESHGRQIEWLSV